MQNSSSSLHQRAEGESEEEICFDKSLKELKDLRSQLYYAADYCEMAFVNAHEKKTVLENTKKYICNAVVTVVDHLGSVSANLDSQLTNNHEVSQAELRLNCLKQRLLTCEIYVHKLTLTQVCWRENFPRYHPRYILKHNSNLHRSCGVLSNSEITPKPEKMIKNHELDMEEDVPLFLYTNNHQPSLAKNLTWKTAVQKRDTNSISVSVLPVRDDLSVLTKVSNPNFYFQATPKLGRNTFGRKLPILSLFRRAKHSRTP